MEYQSVLTILKKRGQEQLLAFYGELPPRRQAALLERIAALDWEMLEDGGVLPVGELSPVQGLERGQIAARREEFFQIGKEAIANGKVAAVLLAGGQGTRLGVNAPKGTYNIGVTRPLYIFECLIGNLKKSVSACGAYVPLYIMTNRTNDGETRDFFCRHHYFGYPKEYVSFFVQDMSPCVDRNGKVLLAEKDEPAISPNGNGGFYTSLEKAGLLPEISARGVEWFNVFAVDNVLQRIADPVFVGATIKSGCMSGAKVVRKIVPEEKVGVLCLRGGLPDVVEYYDLPEETARARRADGSLLYGNGVTLNYLFRYEKLRENSGKKIPVHKVFKKVPYVDESGRKVNPEKENAYKHELLILDLIRLTGSCLPFEVEREKEFAPVKNLTGADSVDTARELLKKNGVEL